jgi:EmrB/QacA subfamily drug resistance transporter
MSEASTSLTCLIRPAEPSALSHAEIMRVMAGVMICILLVALDQTVVIPALPAIGSELGAYTQLSWVVAAYLITTTISTPIYSKLSDIYGRRRLLVVCIALFIGTSILCAMAQSLSQLVWFRALQGLGGGGLMALTQAAIADVMSPRERGRYQAYISAVWAVSSICGPLVGGFLAQSLSWRSIFWINLPVGSAAMWACHNGLRRLASPTLSGKPKLDVLGMVFLSGALSLLLLALGWGGDTYAWGSYQILGPVGLGICLLLLLVLQELRVSDPLLPPRVFTSKSYVANLIVSTLMSLLMFMCLFTIPLYFQLARGATAAQSGFYLAPFLLANAAGNVAGSRYARHYGTMRGEMRIASFLCCAGLTLLAVLPHNVPVWGILVAMIITGPGIGGCFIGSIMSAQNALDARDIGSGTGAFLVMRSVGGASGSTLAGAIIASGLLSIQKAADVTAAPAAHSMQHGAAALADIAKSGLTGAGAHLASSFGMVYAVAAAIAAIALVVTLWMPNSRLREVSHFAAPISE